MSNLTDTNKINYLYKKSFGKPTTLLTSELLQANCNILKGIFQLRFVGKFYR